MRKEHPPEEESSESSKESKESEVKYDPNFIPRVHGKIGRPKKRIGKGLPGPGRPRRHLKGPRAGEAARVLMTRP